MKIDTHLLFAVCQVLSYSAIGWWIFAHILVFFHNYVSEVDFSYYLRFGGKKEIYPSYKWWAMAGVLFLIVVKRN